MFVKNLKTHVTSLLCPQGARVDVPLDEPTALFVPLFTLTHLQQREGLFRRSREHTWEFPTHLKASPLQGSF